MATYKDYMDEGLENYNYDDFTDAIYNFGMAVSVGKNNEEIAEAYFYIGKVYHTSKNDIKQATEFFKKSADYGNKAALQMLKAIGVDYAPVKPAPVAKPAPVPVQVYKIGDKGPAGGIIIYDKGNNSNGWRYMEVSPKHIGQVVWDNAKIFQAKISCTKAGIGEGKRNTELIVAVHKKKNKSETAALRCIEYTLNGFNDWFLPSKDELNEIFKNHQNKAGDFFNQTTLGMPGYVWSSTQSVSDNDRVCVQYYNEQIDVNKNYEFWLRAVRYF